MSAALIALLLNAAAAQPVCVPSKDARVTECAVKDSTGRVAQYQCFKPQSGKRVCL